MTYLCITELIVKEIKQSLAVRQSMPFHTSITLLTNKTALKIVCQRAFFPHLKYVETNNKMYAEFL